MFKKFFAVLAMIGLMFGFLSTSAQANIGAYHWGYGTIHVKNVTPTHPWSADVMNRVLYYHNLNVHWNIVTGDCVIGEPCIRLSIGAYGTSGDWADGVVGNTYFPYLCGGGNTFCNYSGNFNDTTRRMGIAINTSYGDLGLATVRKIGCHEFGHGFSYLHHESNALGATCMNGPIDNNTPEFLNSRDKQQIEDRFDGIAMSPCSGCSAFSTEKMRPGPPHLGTSRISVTPTSADTAITRTFSMYDLTRCGCYYTPGNDYAEVRTAPLVSVTSYFDSYFVRDAVTYQRVNDTNDFKLTSYNGPCDIFCPVVAMVPAPSGGTAHVLCYTYSTNGVQFDKVGERTTVTGGKTYSTYGLYVMDRDIADYVVTGHNHC